MTDVLALAAERPTSAQPDVVDAALYAYIHWREESAWLDEAYEGWAHGPAKDRRLAFAAYGAALDREAAACRVYAIRFERLERALAAGDA
jgi:hypothetical protein